MAPGGTLAGVTECILAYGTRIYTVKGGDLNGFRDIMPYIGQTN